MATIERVPIPEGSLLAEFGPAESYRDCFGCNVPGQVTLEQFIERFYCSTAFRPERLLLGVIGRGANNADAQALARAHSDSFAAWTVVERREDQILLQDFSGATASWLSVQTKGEAAPASSSEALGQHTRLFFGSWVGKPDRPVVKALMPFHRWYSQVLLGGVA